MAERDEASVAASADAGVSGIPAELAEARATIDNIDAALVHILAERFRCTQRVGHIKARLDLPPADSAREARPVEGPVLTDQIISESCGHLRERGPTGFENLTGNDVGIGDQCTQRLEGSGH